VAAAIVADELDATGNERIDELRSGGRTTPEFAIASL